MRSLYETIIVGLLMQALNWNSNALRPHRPGTYDPKRPAR